MEWRKVLLAALALLVCSASALPPPIITNTPYSANLNAETVVLDVNSLSPIATIKSAEDCNQACQRVARSNAYTFCADPLGCGSGCGAYVAAHPKLAGPAASGSYRGASTPITSFGAFAAGNGCKADRWPTNLCTCKRADLAVPLKFYPADGTQWRSGVVSLVTPWEGLCNGVPFAACAQCLPYWTLYGDRPTYDQCLDCVRSLSTAPSTLAKSTAANTCGWCLQKKAGDATYNRAACFTCVKANGLDLEPYVCGQ